jgi:ATP-dependent DNA helicase RecG
LEDGNIQILVGTHALIEPKVKFKNLGYAIIDEQHRFGVAQRAELYKKNVLPPHILVMTATPIPRTLALSFYGDLDVSVIDELPPGRKPIKTIHYRESQRLRLFGFVKEQIRLGRQVYFVYPLIEESESYDYQNLMQGYESLVRYFPLPEYRVAIVHGKMKPEDKDYEMSRFVRGEAHIMVATTVIEVGVNVPNATVMVIESSERFGLAQLHQLRGRVGRGAEQSYCILMTGDKLSSEGKKRLQTMCETNDGFVIAEVDLEIRGPGDIMGTQQSGIIDLKIADLARDGQILTLARNQAIATLDDDPNLEKEENQALKQKMREIWKNKTDWSVVS